MHSGLCWAGNSQLRKALVARYCQGSMHLWYKEKNETMSYSLDKNSLLDKE
jgi:hypothetical protein